jgi:hypothetical protein
VIRLQFRIEIRRRPSEVFAYLTDTRRLHEWQSSVHEAEWQGARAEGARIREVRRFLGRRLELEQEVTAYEPDRRFGLKAVSGQFPFSFTIGLEPTGEGTTLTFSGEGEPGGFFRYAEHLVARAIERQIRHDFETMKVILEGHSST